MAEYARGRSLLGKKLLLCGLSEAGKTAICDVIFRGKTIKEVEGLSATINYIRQIISLEGGKNITLMDLGGQRIFLDRFITKFSPFVFHNVAALIFVVDVADYARFTTSKQYFDAALERLKKYSPTSHVFVLIHKMDLLSHQFAADEILEHLRNLFQKEVDNNITFFETTIYDDRIHEAFKEILKLSFPKTPTRLFQIPMEIPSAVNHHEVVSEISSLSIESSQPTEAKLKLDSETTPGSPIKFSQKPTVEVNILEIAKALAFVENPAKTHQISEPEAREATTVPSQLDIIEELTEEYQNVAEALRFVETRLPASEKTQQTPELLVEDFERPELLTEKLEEPKEEIESTEVDISALLSEDEIKELLPDFQSSIMPQVIPEDVILPATAFESHPTLDEEFDVFTASEELVKFIEEIVALFKLSYIAILMSDGETLVHVGDSEKFDKLVNTVFNGFKMQTETDPTQTFPYIIRAEKLFILVEPTGKTLTLLVIGPTVSKLSFLSKMSILKEKITRMINTTFYDVF